MSVNINYAVTDNYVSKEEYEQYKQQRDEELQKLREYTNRRINEISDEFHYNLDQFDKLYTSKYNKLLTAYIISTIIAYLLIALSMSNIY